MTSFYPPFGTPAARAPIYPSPLASSHQEGGILSLSDIKWEDCMSYSQQTIKAVIRPGEESGYVAECLEIAVVTQGRTLDETVKHLQEATALHLEGENPAAFGLRQKPTLVLTMELDPAHAQAS